MSGAFYVLVSHKEIHSTQNNHSKETDREVHVHRTVECVNHKGNLENLENSLFYGM